mmetsp:Transcript_6259/g.10542  ORF Transcript_6259/g.10542 Transcript_6259/m.10542 type:complete len:111 (-) Transcript_6259:769-1101(-)
MQGRLQSHLTSLALATGCSKRLELAIGGRFFKGQAIGYRSHAEEGHDGKVSGLPYDGLAPLLESGGDELAPDHITHTLEKRWVHSSGRNVRAPRAPVHGHIDGGHETDVQ